MRPNATGGVVIDTRRNPPRRQYQRLGPIASSVLMALGNDPTSVMYELGHADAAFTLRVYSHIMRGDPASKAALRKLVGLA